MIIIEMIGVAVAAYGLSLWSHSLAFVAVGLYIMYLADYANKAFKSYKSLKKP
jgi:hypothetical protein